MLQHGRDATNRGAPRRSSRTRSHARGHPPPPYAPASCVGRCRSGGPPSRAPSTTGPTRPVWSEPSRADSPGAGSRPHGGRGRRRRSSPGAPRADPRDPSRPDPRGAGPAGRFRRPSAPRSPPSRAAWCRSRPAHGVAAAAPAGGAGQAAWNVRSISQRVGMTTNPLEGVGALGHLQADRSVPPQHPDPVHQPPGIRPVRPDVLQPRLRVPEDRQPWLRPIAALHTGGRDDDRQEHAEGIDQAMPLTPLEVRVRIIAAESPVPVVLLDCLSMIPALSWRRLPAAPRTSPRSRSCLCCQVPSFRQRQQSW